MIRPTLARHAARCIHARSSATPYLKYVDKLQQKAQEKGLDLEKLKTQAREEARCKQKEEAATLVASFKRSKTRTDSLEGTGISNTRRDSSPVKAGPLSSILNLSKLSATPHTSSQISALWTAYHASRAQGTGTGYICASLPLEAYNAMTRVAKKYPVFVVPLPRKSTPDPSAGEGTGTAHEFFFLQWDFHSASSVLPAPESFPFETLASSSSSHVPELSTVLFAPLQEYKLHTSFATPYLVLTFYTDLSHSHGIVLLRGEITPGSSSAAAAGQEIPERFLLSQLDAQLLTMGLQRFYLWGDGRKDGNHDPVAETLLKQFHDEPEKFSWQDLINSSNVVG